MIEGWIKSYRKFMEWRWWSDDAVFRFFHGLLYLANLADNGYKDKMVERGSFITSIPSLCTTLHMSEKKVRRCLKCLVSTGEIIDEPTNRDRKITIVNYALYQDSSAILPLSKRQGKGKGKGQDSGKGKGKGKGNPIKERKKCVCLTDTHTQKKEEAASAPHALEERADAVTYGDIRQFQIDNHIGGGEYVSEFYNAFEKSGTRIPENWQDLYIRYVRAGWKAQDEFIERLEKGEYIEKWGRADV